MDRLGRLFWIAALGLVALLERPAAAALSQTVSIAQYKHTTWTAKDAVPSTIFALAHGRDGYLWIGGADGVYRFDGVQFERIVPIDPNLRDQTVSALLGAEDGTVWVGYAKGELAQFQHGMLRKVQAPEHVGYVMGLAQTTDGVIWAIADHPELALIRFTKGRWEQIGSAWGLPLQGFVSQILATRDGSLWIRKGETIFVLDLAAHRFRPVARVLQTNSALSEDAEGRIWISDGQGSRIINTSLRQSSWYPTPSPLRSIHTIFDREGNLWGALSRRGVFRLKAPQPSGERSVKEAGERVDTYHAQDGLASNTATSILEDREGNIWVGSTLGLDRFSSASVVIEPRLRTPSTFGDAMLTASDGTVYIGEANAIYRIRPGGNPEPLIEHIPETQAICEAPDGVVWIILADRFLQLRHGRLSSTPWPHRNAEGIDCMIDRAGVLWAYAGSEGLYRYASSRWTNLRIPLEGGFRPEQLIDNPAHRRLLYLDSGAVVEFDEKGRVAGELLPADPGRDATATYFGQRGLLLGGSFGLGRVQDGRIQIISATRFPWLREPSGIVQTPSGETWLIGRGKIVGVATTDLEMAFVNPNLLLRPTILTFEDGLPDIELSAVQSAATLGGDGRVWFLTVAGVVHVDPAMLKRNQLSPQVSIARLSTQALSYIDPVGSTLPSGTSRIEIAYTALSLSVPDRVRFRYRLEGVDTVWIDPGSRRETSYANLKPGHYRFQVIASNNDGIWNRKGAALDFTIAPTFLQSNWFVLVCTALAALAALLLWAAYSMRIRQLTTRVRERLEVQLAERERIARELHDTLLQGFQGLVLRFQSVANRMPIDSPLRTSIDQALERAEEVLTDGRNRVGDLRFTECKLDLADAIAAVAAKLEVESALPILVGVRGKVRLLNPMVREELLRIGEEAIANALRHAGASRIDVALLYSRDIQLEVRDDGLGLPESVAAAGHRAGHFGLIGMQERAARAGGRMAITSRPGMGTEVRVAVPGGLAYATARAPRAAPVAC